jgi:branched-chain amino acid transport system ATP-binding protein
MEIAMASDFFRLENVSAGYGDVQVLWDISIDVQSGEIACIVGSNGAGKSTTLRLISGLLRPWSGKVTIGGEEIGYATPEQVLAKGVGHVPEGRRLFKGMSVKNNLLMGAYLRRDGEVERDLEFVYNLFPILRERRKQDARTLSGGEQQMCAIGRGILSRPKLLLIDELSLGLAPLVVEQLGEALKEINESGISILLVEQDVMTAFELANRGFVLESGRVTLKGVTRLLADDPTVRQAFMGI